MGTRADFYVGRGPDAEWLGSIAWDGYPDGIVPDEDPGSAKNVFPEFDNSRPALGARSGIILLGGH